MGGDQAIVGGQRGELVGGGGEWNAAAVGQFRCDAGTEFRMGVEPGADSRASDSERGQ